MNIINNIITYQLQQVYQNQKVVDYVEHQIEYPINQNQYSWPLFLKTIAKHIFWSFYV